MGLMFMLATLMLSITAFAAPKVIATFSKVHTYQHYQQPAVNVANLPGPTSQMLSPWPIKTAVLTPGLVNDQEIANGPNEPIFILGSDDRSYQWLKHYAARLKALNATGYVVNVPSAKSYETLLSYADGLTLIPLPGDTLASRFHLTHYPVLLSSHQMEQ